MFLEVLRRSLRKLWHLAKFQLVTRAPNWKLSRTRCSQAAKLQQKSFESKAVCHWNSIGDDSDQDDAGEILFVWSGLPDTACRQIAADAGSGTKTRKLPEQLPILNPKYQNTQEMQKY